MATIEETLDLVMSIDIPQAITTDGAIACTAMKMVQEELIKRLMDHLDTPDEDADDIIFQFRTEMYMLSHVPLEIEPEALVDDSIYVMAGKYAETILAMCDHPLDE